MANKRGRQFSLDVRDKPGLASPGDRRLQYGRVGCSQARLARSLLIELAGLLFSNRMLHGPGPCVLRPEERRSKIAWCRLRLSRRIRTLPNARFPVAHKHRKRNQKLGDSDRTLHCLVPGETAGRQDPSDLQDRGWKSQHAEKESDQDQPESPSPTTEYADHQQSDERRERN